MGGGDTLVDAIRRFFHLPTSINSRHHHNNNDLLLNSNNANNINNPSSLNLLKVPTRSHFIIPSSMDRNKKVLFLLFICLILALFYDLPFI
jgi:hypothetical protein